MFKNKNYLIDTNFSLTFFGSFDEKMRTDFVPPHRFQHPYTHTRTQTHTVAIGVHIHSLLQALYSVQYRFETVFRIDFAGT